MTPAMLAAEDWDTRFPRTFEERVATFVIALREARGHKRLEAVDAVQVCHEVRACAEPETKRTVSEGHPTW